MDATQLIAALDRWDAQGLWCFSAPTLRILFREPASTHNQALRHHVARGLLGRAARGLYYNPRARSLPPSPLEALVPFLRPWDFSYLSLESSLSEHGALSQMPGRLTCMTTGRSGVASTAFGAVEFVHTKRRGPKLSEGVMASPARPIPIATPQRALEDLRAARRNLGLVDVEAVLAP